MSMPNPLDPHHIIAQQIANPTPLTTEQRLFKEALEAVKERRRKHQELPEIFVNLDHARNLDDVKLMVETERARNKIWKHPLGKSWLEIFGKYAGLISTYKPVLDAVTATNQMVAAPIWATINFVIDVFKDIGAAIEGLESTNRILSTSLRRFSIYVEKNIQQMSSNLRTTLSEYYEQVIDFFIDIHREFSQGLSKSTIRVVHRSLTEKLKAFSTTIHETIDNVDKGASIDMMQDLGQQLKSMEGAVNKMSVVPSVGPAPALSPALQMVHGMPQTNRNFTGQRQYLHQIWSMLQQGPQDCQRNVALYGMGGVGKTQILQRYAYDQLKPQPHAEPYDALIWINAFSERSVLATLSSFMEVNGFPEKLVNDRQEVSFIAFHMRLRQHAKKWLLVFDNVVDSKFVKAAIPPGNDGHILFSTRERLIADQLSGKPDYFEVEPMDEASGVEFVSKLAALSSNPDDRGNSTCSDVAKFAGGLPLLMEQVVHNAILGGEGLAKTLEDARNKHQLLKLKNPGSLKEKDLSLGAVVLQTFEYTKKQSARAEALLKILVYLEPSSMPMSLFSDCVGRVQETLDKLCTYDRGATIQRAGRHFDRPASLQVPTMSVQDTKHRHFKSPFRRSRSSQDTARNLPVDDVEPASSLRKVCGPGTPLGQLFENDVTLRLAFELLVNASIVRKPRKDEFWMHDRFSEVAKAIMAEENTVANQHMALAAATMVYIASPTHPSGGVHPTSKAARYFPHLLACQSNLKDIGILNNCSIGPELSHMIASTLEGSRGYDDTAMGAPGEEESEWRARVTRFYQDAFAGYMAGWQRLRTYHNIDDRQIAQHIRQDRDYELSLGRYYVGSYMEDRQRLGRSAPWRAMQTLCRLAYWLQSDPATVELGLTYLHAAIKASTIIFGPNDDDTVYLKRELASQLESTERWQEAYDVNINHMRAALGWRSGDHYHNSMIDFKSVWRQGYVSSFAEALSSCCIALANDPTTPARNGIPWAREAVMWTEMVLRYYANWYGDEYFVNCAQHLRLAEAYEKCGDQRAAIYWYGQAVHCRLAYMVCEGVEWEINEWGHGMVLSGGNEPFIQDTVNTFEEAMSRFIGQGDGKLGNFDDVDVDLRKFLSVVKSKIAIWRKDREMFGVWDPDKEAMDKLKEEYEEREREIERLYGKIPSLDELLEGGGDEDKENLSELHVKGPVVPTQSQESHKELFVVENLALKFVAQLR